MRKIVGIMLLVLFSICTSVCAEQQMDINASRDITVSESFDGNSAVTLKITNMSGVDIKGGLVVVGYFDSSSKLTAVSEFKTIDLLLGKASTVSFNGKDCSYAKAFIFNSTKPEKLFDMGLADYFPDMEYADPKTRFEQVTSELPDEIDVVKNFEVKGETEIYVSPSGNDSNDGSIDKPYKTIEKAFSVASVADKSKGVVIYLREGIYTNNKTLEIPAEISGTNANPVFVSAYKNESVNIIGGVNLPGEKFKPISNKALSKRLTKYAQSKVVEISLKDLGITSLPEIHGSSTGVCLYIDGETMTLSRYPNDGLLPIEKVIDQGPVLDEGQKDDGRGFELGFDAYDKPLSWVDTGNIWIRGGLRWEWNQVYSPIEIKPETKSIHGMVASKYGALEGSNRFFYFNVFEELDFPGEYFIDRDTMTLYIYPFDKIDSSTDVFLTTFNDDMMVGDNLKNVIFNKIKFSSGTANGVRVNYSSDVIFQNCIFRNFGDHGGFLHTCFRSGFVGCDFIQNRNRNIRAETDEATRLKLIPNRNFIQNCCFFGNSDQVLNSMISIAGVGDIVSHNFFANGYATAIGISQWEGVAEYNEVVNSPKYQSDSGSLYTGGIANCSNVQVRYNYFHDVTTNPGIKPYSIYFDNEGSYGIAYGNIMYNMKKGVYSNNGRGNSFVNNIYINPQNNAGSVIKVSESIYHNATTASDGFKHMIGNNIIKPTYEMQKRMPNFSMYLQDIDKIQHMWDKEDYEWGNDFELSLKAPTHGYYANNISLGAKDANSIGEIGQQDSMGLDSTILLDDDPGFVDIENRNFNFKEDAKIFTLNPDFKAPDFDKMGLKFGEGYRTEKPTLGMYGKIKLKFPENNSISEVYNEKIPFKWTDIPWSNYYVLQIASDKNFKNIIKEIKNENEYITLKLDGLGTKYFWRVTAYSDSKSINQTPLVSDTFSFTTMTETDIKQNITLDTSKLMKSVNKAKLLLETMVEGTETGNYETGTRKILEDAIARAEKYAANPDIQPNLEKEEKAMTDALLSIRTKEVYGYVDLDLNAANYSTTATSVTIKNNEEGDLELSSTSGYPTIRYKDLTKYRQIFRLQMKIEKLDGWWGITPTFDSAVRTRYFFVMQPTFIECQKTRPNSTSKTGIVQNYENNLKLMKSDTWHEIEVGNISIDGGVWCYMSVDGTKILDWTDKDDPNLDDGYLEFMLNSANGKISFRKSQITDKPLPVIQK